MLRRSKKCSGTELISCSLCNELFPILSWIHAIRRAEMFYSKLNKSVDDETKEIPVDLVMLVSTERLVISLTVGCFSLFATRT